MLTLQEKKLLENKICKLIRESIFENGFYENGFGENGFYEASKNEHNEDDDKKPSKIEKERYDLIIRWLDTAQELHSVLSYELWPDKDKDTARSEFSKKYRGHDDDGKKYRFTEDEVNDLYNMREDFIDRAGLKTKA